MGDGLHLQDFKAFDGKSAEAKLQEIADREEIRELVSRYAHGIAQRAQVAGLFTEDGIFIQRIPGQPPEQHQGRAALVPMYEKVAATVGPLPMIHNHIVDIQGDGATGLCSIELRMSANGQSMIASGYYEDVYRRVDGRWRFAKRDASIFHLCTLQEGWAGK